MRSEAGHVAAGQATGWVKPLVELSLWESVWRLWGCSVLNLNLKLMPEVLFPFRWWGSWDIQSWLLQYYTASGGWSQEGRLWTWMTQGHEIVEKADLTLGTFCLDSTKNLLIDFFKSSVFNVYVYMYTCMSLCVPCMYRSLRRIEEGSSRDPLELWSAFGFWELNPHPPKNSNHA